MSAEQQLEKEIREACVFLREKNHIPSETIQFILDASLEKINNFPIVKTYCFDCWKRDGKLKTKYIKSICPEDAKIIFEHKYPDYNYDEPYC